MASGLDRGVAVSADAPITAESYDASYYGNGGQTANYCNYNGASTPHWSAPLARWLWEHCAAPFLDVGCAFGHLVRDLNRLSPTGLVRAQGIEWSPFAFMHNVAPEGSYFWGDARSLGFADATFNTVVSLDFLEHHVPEDTIRCLQEMDRVLRPGGFSVHLIGAVNPSEDLSLHKSDPTHQNHEPLGWYIQQMHRAGWDDEPELTADLRAQPAWVNTDWRGRMVVLHKCLRRDG
jgi:SAM-dependent methyltransferase